MLNPGMLTVVANITNFWKIPCAWVEQGLWWLVSLTCKTIGLFIDLLNIAFYIFAGIEVKGDAYNIVNTTTGESVNILDYFIFDQNIIKSYFTLVLIGLALIAIFTIYKIIKQDYFDRAGPRSKGPIFRNVAISCIAFVLVVPIFYLVIHASSLLAVQVLSALGTPSNTFAGMRLFEMSWSDGGESFHKINNLLEGNKEGSRPGSILYMNLATLFTLFGKGEYVAMDPGIVKKVMNISATGLTGWNGPLAKYGKTVLYEGVVEVFDSPYYCDFYWYIFIFAAAGTFLALFKLVKAMVYRIVMLVGLFLVAPAPISQYVLDDGVKFKNWYKQIIARGLSVVSCCLCFSIYLLILGSIGNIDFYSAFSNSLAYAAPDKVESMVNVGSSLLAYTPEFEAVNQFARVSGSLGSVTATDLMNIKNDGQCVIRMFGGNFECMQTAFSQLINTFLQCFLVSMAAGAVEDLDGQLSNLIADEMGKATSSGTMGEYGDKFLPKAASIAGGAVGLGAKFGGAIANKAVSGIGSAAGKIAANKAAKEDIMNGYKYKPEDGSGSGEAGKDTKENLPKSENDGGVNTPTSQNPDVANNPSPVEGPNNETPGEDSNPVEGPSNETAGEGSKENDDNENGVASPSDNNSDGVNGPTSPEDEKKKEKARRKANWQAYKEDKKQAKKDKKAADLKKFSEKHPNFAKLPLSHLTSSLFYSAKRKIGDFNNKFGLTTKLRSMVSPKKLLSLGATGLKLAKKAACTTPKLLANVLGMGSLINPFNQARSKFNPSSPAYAKTYSESSAGSYAESYSKRMNEAQSVLENKKNNLNEAKDNLSEAKNNENLAKENYDKAVTNHTNAINAKNDAYADLNSELKYDSYNADVDKRINDFNDTLPEDQRIDTSMSREDQINKVKEMATNLENKKAVSDKNKGTKDFKDKFTTSDRKNLSALNNILKSQKTVDKFKGYKTLTGEDGVLTKLGISPDASFEEARDKIQEINNSDNKTKLEEDLAKQASAVFNDGTSDFQKGIYNKSHGALKANAKVEESLKNLNSANSDYKDAMSKTDEAYGEATQASNEFLNASSAYYGLKKDKNISNILNSDSVKEAANDKSKKPTKQMSKILQAKSNIQGNLQQGENILKSGVKDLNSMQSATNSVYEGRMSENDSRENYMSKFTDFADKTQKVSEQEYRDAQDKFNDLISNEDSSIFEKYYDKSTKTYDAPQIISDINKGTTKIAKHYDMKNNPEIKQILLEGANELSQAQSKYQTVNRQTQHIKNTSTLVETEVKAKQKQFVSNSENIKSYNDRIQDIDDRIYSTGNTKTHKRVLDKKDIEYIQSVNPDTSYKVGEKINNDTYKQEMSNVKNDYNNKKDGLVDINKEISKQINNTINDLTDSVAVMASTLSEGIKGVTSDMANKFKSEIGDFDFANKFTKPVNDMTDDKNANIVGNTTNTIFNDSIDDKEIRNEVREQSQDDRLQRIDEMTRRGNRDIKDINDRTVRIEKNQNKENKEND